MKKCFRGFATALIAAAVMFPQMSFAATANVKATVTQLLTSDGKFGECMALLSTQDDSLSCSRWVTFDCTASLSGNTKASASRKFNLAQLALVTGNRVFLVVDDSKKINGQCFATRIDVGSR